MARTGEGGGYGARQVTHVNSPKREVINRPVSPGAVSRIGGMMPVGSDYKPLYYNKVTASTPEGPTPMTPDMCKPGGGRRVLASGSQSSVSPPRSMGKTRPF
jgi:hypothetical protein